MPHASQCLCPILSTKNNKNVRASASGGLKTGSNRRATNEIWPLTASGWRLADSGWPTVGLSPAARGAGIP